MDENPIVWKLDEERSSEKTCLLAWEHIRMRVDTKGSVMIYPVPTPGLPHAGRSWVRFPDLADLYHSLEQAMNLVLGHLPNYEGEV